MKRKVIAVLLTSAMALSMAACGGGGSSDGGSSDGGSDAAATDDGAEAEGEEVSGSGGENTLTVWTWDPQFNVYAIEKAAEIYAANGHDGFSVEVEEVLSDDIDQTDDGCFCRRSEHSARHLADAG